MIKEKENEKARVDRRKFLRTTAAAFGASALLPLLGGGNASITAAQAPSLSTSNVDPDQLFRAGMFAEADWGYQRILAEDPDNVHALARRGFIALLSNNLRKAEYFLHRAVCLAPADNDLKQWLADCFVRRDDFAGAAPLLRESGNPATADQYESISGKPYEIRGAKEARLPFLAIDPLPVVEAAVNGISGAFILDTGATLSLKTETAEEAGLRVVATTTVPRGNGQLITMNLGVMDSFQLAGIELRNIPVFWTDTQLPPIPSLEKQPVGALGTTVLYHFLSTLDYANEALILRRKEQLSAFHESEASAPLYLAPDHFLFSRGSVNDLGPALIKIDTGGPGIGIGMTDEIAAQAGIVPDYTMPRQFFGVTVYPCVAAEAALGAITRHEVPGIVGPLPSRESSFGFESIATFSHEFFRPLTVTFDFVDMNIYIRE